MTESDAPQFKIVDNRSAVQTESGDISPDAIVDTSDSEATAGAPAEDSLFTDDIENSNTSSPGLPDPSFLINMAAVQLDTVSLIESLIPIFDQYAWSSMGFVANPRTGEPMKDMATAQIAIDTIQFLLSKVESRFSPTEKRDHMRRLSDLRMNYLAKLKES